MLKWRNINNIGVLVLAKDFDRYFDWDKSIFWNLQIKSLLDEKWKEGQIDLFIIGEKKLHIHIILFKLRSHYYLLV